VDDGCKLKTYPKDWELETKDVIEQNSKFKDFFEDYFEIDSEGKVSKRQIETRMKEFLRGNYNIKDELKKLRINFRYNSQERENGDKGFFHGFKLATSKEEPETFPED
jgi:hypothetical protein